MALGMIEVYGFATAIVVADAAAKAADVKVVALDRNKPANGDAARVPLVMAVKLEGTPAAVEAAMEAMGEVTGATVREDITARIFERFCVGK